MNFKIEKFNSIKASMIMGADETSAGMGSMTTQ
jgi:hypothetical protein